MARPIFTLTFWADALERAVASAAGAVVALGGASYVGALEFDWAAAGSLALGAAAFSVLKALAASATGDGSASLVK